MAKEIWKVIFGHFNYEIDDGKIHQKTLASKEYVLGRTVTVDEESLTPKKITVKKDGLVRVEFEELGIRHEFQRDEKTELFYRDKVKKDAKETTDRTE